MKKTFSLNFNKLGLRPLNAIGSKYKVVLLNKRIAISITLVNKKNMELLLVTFFTFTLITVVMVGTLISDYNKTSRKLKQLES